MRPTKWAYGVTTVPKRFDDLLPRTLKSLAAAGFDRPRVFVDGISACDWSLRTDGLDQYPTTLRDPMIRTAGNWALALAELYIREPACDRYAMFQDDFVTYKNLRAYLDKVPYPKEGYWNLYTFPSNQRLAPETTGFYLSAQNGRGAVALVFDLLTVTTLLRSEHFVMRPQDVDRGHRSIDGGVFDSLRKAGWKEYVHNPSLTQHTGRFSSMGNRPHKLAESFRGENFDALELLS